jgi:hypothetical protein
MNIRNFVFRQVKQEEGEEEEEKVNERSGLCLFIF